MWELIQFLIITAVVMSNVHWGWTPNATGLWVIGLFIGINLIVYGIAWIALALGLRGS